LILDNRRPRATLYRKTEDGEGLVTAFSAGATIPLAGRGLDLPVEQIYEGVTLYRDPASGVE
jgi:Uma2 family endonuclease